MYDLSAAGIRGGNLQVRLDQQSGPKALFIPIRISTAVRELEQELGIRIFARSNRGVEFTQEGKEFLSYAVSLLEQKHRVESLYGESRNDAPMRFSVSSQRYPFCVDAFFALAGRGGGKPVPLSIRETGMDAVIDDVYDHRSDVGDHLPDGPDGKRSSAACWTPGILRSMSWPQSPHASTYAQDTRWHI